MGVDSKCGIAIDDTDRHRPSPLKKHALFLKSGYMLREFPSVPVHLKIHVFKNFIPDSTFTYENSLVLILLTKP